MRSLYDADVLRWSEEQAAALRSAAGSEAAALADWDRLADAVERVGRSALNHVEAGLRQIFVQAIAGYCDPDSLLRHERNHRVLLGQHEAERDLSPTIKVRIDLDRLWSEAFDRAMEEIPRRPLGVPPSIPQNCPFTLREVLADDFTYDRAVERLYTLLTSWRPKAAKEAIE